MIKAPNFRNSDWSIRHWSVAFITNLKRNALKPTRHHQHKFSTLHFQMSKKKHPWMFKQPKSATEVQKETSFSGRPLRRKSCMQLHLIGCSFGMVPVPICFFWNSSKPMSPLVEKICIGKKNKRKKAKEHLSLGKTTNHGNLSTVAFRRRLEINTPWQRLSVNKSPSGQILSVDLPSPL